VLRKTNVAEKQLIFHTDTRSQKWQEIQQNASIAIHFYDAATRVQIRINGKATLHNNDALADAAWAKSNLSCKRTYMTSLAPSMPISEPASGLTAHFETNDPTEEEATIARPFFGVVVIEATAVDWLWLNNKGHRRAKFFYENGALLHSTWLAP
jgi:pyridoxine/pyridoxamine 5'-phosphate oxidase